MTVFTQGYENRGPNNERKRIYQSAVTPDLIESKYRAEIDRFYKLFLADANAGTPLMKHYFDNYYDLYRRCPGEQLTVEFIKELLRNIWRDGLTFVRLDNENPGQVPIGGRTVLNDDIAFQRAR